MTSAAAGIDTAVAPIPAKTRQALTTLRLNEREIEKREVDIARLQMVGQTRETTSITKLYLPGFCPSVEPAVISATAGRLLSDQTFLNEKEPEP